MEHNHISPLYRLIKWGVKLCYPKITVCGQENLPQGPSVIVGNHSQLHGPIAAELYTPGLHDTWCAGQMMNLKEVPDYAYVDFWSYKPRWSQWFWRLMSYAIAPLCVVIFNNADTIGVYHDSRVISTFKTTVKRLQDGSRVVIFPEHNEPYNHILCQFQDRFIDLAKMYYKRTGEALSFVPMYLAPRRREMHYGKPIVFDPSAPMEEERQRICQALKDSITELAVSLPEHTVIPYLNKSKKDYGTNRLSKEALHA